MFGANAIWGVMSPIAKFVMISGTITPWVVTNLRIAGAMILFWLVSLFMKPEHVGSKDLAKALRSLAACDHIQPWLFHYRSGNDISHKRFNNHDKYAVMGNDSRCVFLKEPITGKK